MALTSPGDTFTTSSCDFTRRGKLRLCNQPKNKNPNRGSYQFLVKSHGDSTLTLGISEWKNVRTIMTGMNMSQDLDPNRAAVRKTAIIDGELYKRKIDIAALQETRLSGSGTIKEQFYAFFWFGKTPEEPRLNGTGLRTNAGLNNIVNYTGLTEMLIIISLVGFLVLLY